MNEKAKKWIAPVLTLIIVLLPFGFRSYYTMRILSTLGIYLIISMGLNVLLGFTGLVSIGQAGIFGISAYVCGIFMERAGVNFWVAFFLAILVGLIVGLVLGTITLKLESGYLAITTLGLCLMVKNILQNWSSMTNGFEGLLGIPKPNLFGYVIRSQKAILVTVVICAVLVFWLLKFFLGSKYGRNLRASRDNEIASSMMGIDVVRTRLLAFTVASVTAALAGWLYAGLYGALFPDYFNMDLSVLFMCIVIVGGQGTIIGPIIGAFVVVYGKELLGGLGEGQMLVYGIILVALCVLQPRGLAGLISKGAVFLKNKVTKKKEDSANG
jgi:branched-chain amino acid transport system permease protein